MHSCKDDNILRSSGLTTVFGGPLVAAEGKMSDSVSILSNVTNFSLIRVLSLVTFSRY